MYQFFYRPLKLSLQDQWGLSSPAQDYAQMEELRLSHVNRDYSVCPSQPLLLLSPHSIDDETLVKVAKFRRGLLPCPLLSHYRKNGMVIMCSSRTLTGANWKRCRVDALLLQSVIDSSGLGYIFDTRSKQYAPQTRMTEGRFESRSSYSSWKRLHCQLERKVLQESLIKLVEACGDHSHSVDCLLSKLENSQFFHGLHTHPLKGDVSRCMRDGHTVLVHGSEDTDITLLVSSSAQLILDPNTRTLAGFLCVLMEPMGRSAASSVDDAARVWQLARHFLLAAGFSEPLLLRLANEVYASDYATATRRVETVRCAAGVKERTHCLFQSLLRPCERERYSNPLYEPTELVIWPSIQPQSLQLRRGELQSAPAVDPKCSSPEGTPGEIRNLVIEEDNNTVTHRDTGGSSWLIDC
uniref:Zgc:154055 n=1 Tax=Salmo trutta TaxID=8032 RepID=A0A674EPL2_SALTR